MRRIGGEDLTRVKDRRQSGLLTSHASTLWSVRDAPLDSWNRLK